MSGNVDAILDQLRGLGEVRSKGAGKWLACCPAHNDRKPSLSVDLGRDGRVLLTCRSHGCSAEQIVEALGLTLSDLFPDDPSSPSGSTDDDVERRVRRAAAIWNEATSSGVDHPLARAYFDWRLQPAASCDDLPGGKLPPQLRFHPACGLPRMIDGRWDDEPGPAVLGLMVNSANKPRGLQRIYLEQLDDGSVVKRRHWREGVQEDDWTEKRSLGQVRGCCCRLTPGPVEGVLIACEGIETGIAILAAVGGSAGVWPALSTSGLRSIELPVPLRAADGPLRHFIIAADADEANAKGERAGDLAARAAAARIHEQAPHVEISIASPGVVGSEGKVSA